MSLLAIVTVCAILCSQLVSCDKEFRVEVLSNSDKTYVYESAHFRNYTDAVAFCESIGAVLADVRSKEEFNWISDTIKPKDYWLGVQSASHELPTHYLNGDKIDNYNWLLDNYGSKVRKYSCMSIVVCESCSSNTKLRWLSLQCKNLFFTLCTTTADVESVRGRLQVLTEDHVVKVSVEFDESCNCYLRNISCRPWEMIGVK